MAFSDLFTGGPLAGTSTPFCKLFLMKLFLPDVIIILFLGGGNSTYFGYFNSPWSFGSGDPLNLRPIL